MMTDDFENLDTEENTRHLDRFSQIVDIRDPQLWRLIRVNSCVTSKQTGNDRSANKLCRKGFWNLNNITSHLQEATKQQKRD